MPRKWHEWYGSMKYVVESKDSIEWSTHRLPDNGYDRHLSNYWDVLFLFMPFLWQLQIRECVWHMRWQLDI